MESIQRKSLLYKSDVEYSDFSVNHVLGCSHGCAFPCYAMMMAKRFGWIKSYSDWLKPKLVANALELLDKEIPRFKNRISFVHLCFMTDPFMYGYPDVSKMSLKIIEKLNANGIKSTALTKGIIPKALADVERYGANNEYGITLVSLNSKFKNKFEPFSAPYSQRIRSLKNLSDFGLKTWVSMEPYPTPNLSEQDLGEILNKISFADKIVFGKLNYNTKSRNFPDNKQYYEQCAKEVLSFCRRNKIDCHIKYGTQEKYNKTSASLFH